MIQIGEDYRLECVENFEEFAEDSSLDIYVGLTDYTTESSKQPDFRYTLPLFTTGLSLLSKGYETSEAFRFLTIFDTTLWLIIIAGIFFVAHLIWAYEKDEKGAFDPDYGKGILYALNQTILVVFFANNLNVAFLFFWGYFSDSNGCWAHNCGGFYVCDGSCSGHLFGQTG